MNSSKTTHDQLDFSPYVDTIFGTICILIFLIGTFGNIFSFSYFISKKRDISNVIYRCITVTDLALCVAVLPVGISFCSQRKPGLIFGNAYTCLAWAFLWKTGIGSSYFLVMCLSISRTWSLFRPFDEQKVRYFLLAKIGHLVTTLVVLIRLEILVSMENKFIPSRGHCDWIIPSQVIPEEHHMIFVMGMWRSVFCLAPAFVVTICCIISGILLTKSNKTIRQRNLRASRYRATVTILLFALLYGVCNIPLVFEYIFKTYSRSKNDMNWYRELYKFDTQLYYYNATNTLLIAANSAANPILYFWRMPHLRRGIMAGKTMKWVGRISVKMGSVFPSNTQGQIPKPAAPKTTGPNLVQSRL